MCVWLWKPQKWSQLQESERRRVFWSKLQSRVHSSNIVQCNLWFWVHVNDTLVSWSKSSHGVGVCILNADCLKVLLPLATLKKKITFSGFPEIFFFFFVVDGGWAEWLVWEERNFYWCCCNSHWPQVVAHKGHTFLRMLLCFRAYCILNVLFILSLTMGF